MGDRSFATVSIREALVATAWVSLLLAALFVFPNWIANTVMLVSTCLAVSLIFLAFIVGGHRARVFACGALPPIAIAATQIPDALHYLPFIYQRSLVLLISADPFSGDASFSPAADPFPESGYSRFYRVAVAMHFLGGILGYSMLVTASLINRRHGEPFDAPKDRSSRNQDGNPNAGPR